MKIWLLKAVFSGVDFKGSDATADDYIIRITHASGQILVISGASTTVWFYNNNHQLHKEDGAAYSMYGPNGELHKRIFYSRGVKHRPVLDGPAVEELCKGKLVTREYWLSGRNITKYLSGAD